MDFFSWIALPLFIFFARIADVSMGTLRVIFISKGFKYYAPIVGFFESFIWLLAISQIMANITNMWLMVVYALGFSTGTYTGVWLEEKISIGKARLRLVVRTHVVEVLEALERRGYLLTVVTASYKNDTAKVITLLIDRSKVKKVLKIVKSINPKVFYSIEDVRQVTDGEALPAQKSFIQSVKEFHPFRKAK